MPSMNAVKTIKLPGYLPPTHVIFYVLFFFNAIVTFFFLSTRLSLLLHFYVFHRLDCIGTQKLASSLVRYPVESKNTFR